MEVVGRLLFAAAILEERISRVFKTADLATGEFDVLATLRRQGSPYELTPTALYRELLLSSGAMTHRLDVLSGRGFVERQPDPDDRRGSRVRLTAAGLSLIDQIIELHLENERRLLESLTYPEQETLAALMRKWITNLPE